jgi:hypothetical protein
MAPVRLAHRLIAGVCTATIAVSAPALAAPMTEIATRVGVLLGHDGAIAGLEHSWTFDKGYAAAAVKGLDTNGDGSYSRDELAELARVNIDGLQATGFFLAVEHDGRPVELAAPTRYWMEMPRNRPLTLTFVTPLKAALRPTREPLLLGTHDWSGRIRFVPAAAGAVEPGGGAADCRLQVDPARRLRAPTHAGARHVVVVVCVAGNVAGIAERRIALVIGNSRYANAGPLANPANDARALAGALRRLRFSEVVELYDVDNARLRAALKAFGDKADAADWAVVYFAGHGIQVEGQSYILPTDVVLARPAHVADEAISVDHLLSKLAGARRLRLAILDACRTNPFLSRMLSLGRTRGLARGLARIEPSGGVLVAYAARDGQVADDGEGSHSPFAEALLQHLEEPGLEIGLLFRRVRDAVLKRTDNAQEPFVYGSLPSEGLYFQGGTRRGQ